MTKESKLATSLKRCITTLVTFKEFRKRVKALELTVNELAVLRTIQAEDLGQGVSVKKLSEKAKIPNSTASAAGGRLYRDEYLDKFFDRKRPGEVLYRLTDKAHCYLLSDDEDNKERRDYYVQATKNLAKKRGEEVWSIVTEWLEALSKTMEEVLEKEKEDFKNAADKVAKTE